MTKQTKITETSKLDVATSISIPANVKADCKKRGIKFKRCFMLGYRQLVGGEVLQTKKNNKKIADLEEGNAKLHRKLTELSLKIYDLEQKNAE